MGFTQGSLAAMVTETAPSTLRGTAFGVFNLARGLCMLVAGGLAGWLWDRFGSSTTFLAGAALVLMPLLLCWFAPRWQHSASDECLPGTAMNRLEAFNQALFLRIYSTTATPEWEASIASCIADYLIYLVPLLLAVMWLWGGEAQRRLAARACLVAMLGVGINQLIGIVWQHPRPFMIRLGHTSLTHSPDSSFPSDHATVFVGIALTLLLGGARLAGGLTLAAGLLVAWARVFVGIHFPLDMIDATAVACVTYTLIAPLWHFAGRVVTRCAIVAYGRILARPIDMG